jgi:hypothetical protein
LPLLLFLLSPILLVMFELTLKRFACYVPTSQ